MNLIGPPISTWAQAANDKSDNQVTFDLVADLKNLSAPALIIEGKDDLITPRFLQERIQASIPLCRLVVFEQSGHFPFIEEPERFFGVVTEFLRK